MTRIRHIAVPLSCLLLVQGDCLRPPPDSPFEHPTATAPYLGGRICHPFSDPFIDSLAEVGYHECPIAPVPSVGACRMAVDPYLEDSVRAAVDAGLRYAEDCLEQIVTLSGAPMSDSGTWLDCENDCQVFYGDQPEGSSCESFGHRMSDCAQGLVCAGPNLPPPLHLHVHCPRGWLLWSGAGHVVRDLRCRPRVRSRGNLRTRGRHRSWLRFGDALCHRGLV